LDSVFRVLEPVVSKINEWPNVHNGRSDWFRVYRVRTPHLPPTKILKINVFRQDFFLPSVSYDLVFLKARIAIFCSKGFEILDLSGLVVTSYYCMFTIGWLRDCL
jgi:hypothetical protein